MRASALMVVALAAAVVAAGGASGASSDAGGDIHTLVAEIERLHPQPYHSISRDAFHRAADDLPGQIRDALRGDPGKYQTLAAVGGRIGKRLGIFKAWSFSVGIEPIDADRVLHLYLAEHLIGQPEAREDHDEVRWVSAGELDSLPWLPADRPLLAAVAATCAEWKRIKYKVGVHAELDRYTTLMQTLDTLTEKAKVDGRAAEIP